IAQPRVIVVARAKPAIVHHEAFYADLCRLFGQSFLSGLVNVELRRFPGVVKNRPRLNRKRARKDELARKTVQHPRGLAKAVVTEAAVERGRLELFPGIQRIYKIKSVVSARDTDLLVRRLLYGKPPRPAPT